MLGTGSVGPNLSSTVHVEWSFCSPLLFPSLSYSIIAAISMSNIKSSLVLLCLVLFAYIWNLGCLLCLRLKHLEFIIKPHEPHICRFLHTSLLHVSVKCYTFCCSLAVWPDFELFGIYSVEVELDVMAPSRSSQV